MAYGNYKHGHASRGKRTREFNIWLGIKGRCHRPKNGRYKYYGAKGITVCDAWRNDFSAFITDMGMPPSEKHTLERVDNNGPYSPNNCRWATRKEQARNRSTSHMLTAWGETRCMAEWAERFNMAYGKLQARITKGMTPEDALTAPPLR